MSNIYYKNNELYIENVPLAEIASQFETPCYVYSRATITSNWLQFHQALGDFPHRICYAVKANSNLAILNLLAKLNSGFDIVSQGELERVLRAGGDPQKIVFSGVGKKTVEIVRALNVGIFCFNVESEEELYQLNNIAEQQNCIANISLRINPNINAGTHPYIATGLSENKFGIDLSHFSYLCEQLKNLNHLKLIGIGCHIGSQLTDLDPFLEALDCLLNLVDKLKQKGISLQNINIGGGLGIRYQNENPPTIQTYISAIKNKLKNSELELILEPGRSIVADAGVLLTRIQYLKHSDHKNFAIVDAAMNDIMRPALYDAWQNIIPVTLSNEGDALEYDIVGPVCETADFLGKNRKLTLKPDDLLAICSAGAYGFCMSSNYNSRPRAAEVLVDGSSNHLIRKRETIADLFADEIIVAELSTKSDQLIG